MITAIICAILSGTTVVLSRSVNGYLSYKLDPYQSTFFNYFIGLITSSILLLIMRIIGTSDLSFIQGFYHPIMLLGGVIGVLNILILNTIVKKISPVKLTLIAFVAQLLTGIILDYLIYHVFSIKKLIGCIIVIIGLTIYQLSENSNT